MSPPRRTALVTGASRGIGRALALRLARDGLHVIAHYGRSRRDAEGLRDDIVAAGGAVTLVSADLAAADALDDLSAAALNAAPHGLDLLVHNAGLALRKPFFETRPDEVERLFAVNMIAPYRLTQALAPSVNEGGAIVFVSSVVARRHFEGMAAYAMSKAAIEALVIHLAQELGVRGVRVNAVAPGAVGTDMTPAARDPIASKAILDRQALKRIAQAEDVADAVALLASADARWMTGCIIPVSGGTKL